MNTKSSFIRTYALAGGFSLATVIGASGATILGNDTAFAQNSVIPVAHGSNEVGTPNVALAWTTNVNGAVNEADPPVAATPTWQSYTNWNGRGRVYQIDQGFENAQYSVAFTPDAGFGVLLTSTELDVFAGGGDFNFDWTVVGSSSGTIASGSIVATDPGRTTLNFGAAGVGSETVTMTLTIGAGSGTNSYIAMDNLSFDQVAIPEPSTSLLAAAGLGALALRRRRK